MALLLLLLADSLPVVYGQAILDRLHTYDVVAYEVSAEPRRSGLDVDCRLTVRVNRRGPLRFFLSPDVDGLRVTRGDQPVPASLGAGGFETIVRLFAGPVEAVPSLLTLQPEVALEAGEEATFRLRYRWEPTGEGWFYADREGVQTHLSGFWLPLMADERFSVRLTVKTPLQAVGPGRRTKIEGGWRFETDDPVQLVSLVVGRFHARREGDLTVLVPRRRRAEAAGLLEDLSAVTNQLDSMFGPLGRPFTLVVEPRERNAPSYCADAFAVVDPRVFDTPRFFWISLLAHECSHRWWGHSVGTTVVGGAGTWLREGLAQWSGIKVAGSLLGPSAEHRLWRGNFRGYMSRIDVRRSVRPPHFLFANEPNLIDATYIDDPRIAYWRGGLVLRAIETRSDGFADSLRGFAGAHANRFATLDDFVAAVGEEEMIEYYAKSTRFPDFALGKVKTGEGWARGEITCSDPAWPRTKIRVAVTTGSGTEVVLAVPGPFEWKGTERPKRIEIDPDRIWLDPIRSNNFWPATP